MDNKMYSQNGRNSKLVLYAVLMALASVLLSRSGLSTLIYFIPVLLVSVNIISTRNAVLYFIGTISAILGWKFFDLRGLMGDSSNLGIIFFALVYNVMVLASVLTWVSLREYSNNVIRKLLICSVSSSLIGILFVVWYNAFATEEQITKIIELYRQVFSIIRSEEYALQLPELVFTIIMLTVVPFGMVMSSFQILVSEFIIHKRDENWQRDFSLIKLPDKYLYLFIGLWLMTGASALVSSIPALLKAVLLNIAFGFSLHYVLTGISILFFYVRSKRPYFTAGKMYGFVIITMLIPLLNFFILITLIFLSISEVWLKFRKRNS